MRLLIVLPGPNAGADRNAGEIVTSMGYCRTPAETAVDQRSKQ